LYFPLLGGDTGVGRRKEMRKTIYTYNPKLKEFAKKLRNNPTKSEKLLWQALKGRQRKGFDFDRQKPIVEFIVDFFCNELKLGIEIDGITHDFDEVIAKDKLKSESIEELGIKIIRFTDDDVLGNLEGVVVEIDRVIDERLKEI
jgi:very-short-patch-repair endonuclease